ncbi:c-type cytochrome [Oleiagrimonas soli]|uniref:Mono/diheme cytochrome c family protein n=1 Tax=Oleiagrimonas soli TaxID=1543381 RepID=A0A099D0Z9_9GAMM|nr:c-type cytochrome [Oleiagrimonas soli]KGI78960.1 hypothetical protein LF63_0101800 [Oleiagrimonas soli]MBB6184527.1 mono/diheme cytochrome c family protein [Oleiagrimonas soli]
MKKRHRFVLHGLIAVVLLAASAAGSAAPSGALRVCVDRSNPAQHMDRKVAAAVAAQLGQPLRVHAFDGSGDDEGFALKHFRTLLHDDCDLVMGFPMETVSADAGTPPGTQASTPYARTGFVLVTPRHGGARQLSELPAGSMVAVLYQTTPNLYFIDHPKLQADVYLGEDQAVSALLSGKVAAAMLWRPSLAARLHGAAGARFVEHPLHEAHANFDLVALYADPKVGQRFDAALKSLRHSGRLQAMLAPYAEPVPSSATADLLRPHTRPTRTCGESAKPRHAATRVAAPPALFTEAQMAEGKAKFEDHCSQCHGPNLEGRAGPALKGPLFASADADFHVRDIFTIVSQNMPATQPGSLSHEDYVQIMAFILSQNGYPSGSSKLTYEDAMKSTVPLRYHVKQ